MSTLSRVVYGYIAGGLSAFACFSAAPDPWATICYVLAWLMMLSVSAVFK